MTNPSQDLLTTTEGVDEGSAASTVEGPDRTGESEATPAPPVDIDTGEGRGAGGPGQQLEAGEG